MKDIINKYKNGEISIEEANAQLKEAGAGYFFKPMTDEERDEKKAREDALGFFEPEERGFARKPVYPQEPDMSKKPELAGYTVIQKTVAGLFEVTYDEAGYAVEAKRYAWTPPQA